MHFKYDKANYPSEPIFTQKVDKEGREYFTAYSNTQGFCCISIGKRDGKNYIFEGNPKINYRKGDSIFGNEIFFEILIKEKKEVTPKKTDYDSVEIYMPFDKGIEFLERTVRFFKKNCG